MNNGNIEDEIEQETALLEEFIGTKLRDGSELYKRLSKFVADFDHERAVARRNRNRLKSTPIAKSTASTPSTTTAATVVQKENTADSTGHIDDMKIFIVEKIITANLTNTLTPFSALSIAAHCILLREGFIAIAEQGNNVPGFAPSLRELPKGMLLPPNWCKDNDAISFLYKHKLANGKQFTISTVKTGDGMMMITLAVKKGITSTTEVQFEQFINAEDMNMCVFEGKENDLQRFLINMKDFCTKLMPSIHLILPSLQNQAATLSQTTDPRLDSVPNSSSSMAGSGSEPSHQPSYNVGREDLEPALGRGGMYPGVGSMVGPDHPMFNPYYGGGHEDDFIPGGGGIFGPPGSLPQPRYDPVGPFPGPGRGGRGRGGRNGGRGMYPPGAPCYPGGDPSPDHLRPPGW